MTSSVERIILAGFGGQGILFMGKVLAEVGMHIGKHVSWIPLLGGVASAYAAGVSGATLPAAPLGAAQSESG